MRRLANVSKFKYLGFVLKFNAGKSKVMLLNGEEELQCEVHVDGIRLEHVSEFKYFGCVFDESGKDGAECNRMVASGRRVAGAVRSLVNARDLHLEYARILHETLLVPVLIYGSETMIPDFIYGSEAMIPVLIYVIETMLWKENE